MTIRPMLPPHGTVRGIIFAFLAASLCGTTLLAQTSIFTVQPTPNPNRQGNTLNAVVATSASDAWAVGYKNDNNLNESRTLTLHWDGTSWKNVASPNPGNTPNCRNQNTGNYINAAAATAPNDVWAVGFFFTCNALLKPMALHWDGLKWTAVPTPALNTNDNAALNGVVALAADNVYAVGYQPASNGAVLTLVEHWDGTSWSVVTSPNASSTGNVLTAVTASSSGDVWAVGNSTDQPTTSIQTLVEHFNGSAWSIVPSPSPLPKAFLNQNVMTAVTATSPTDVTAVGFLLDSANLRTLTLIEHWNGSAWSVVDSPNPSVALGSVNTLRGVAAVSASDIYAVGFFANSASQGQDKTLVEHFDGTSWTVISSPAPALAQQLNGAFALPQSTSVWIVGALSPNGIDFETGFLQIPRTLAMFTPQG